MKRINTKLQFKRETVRVLHGRELASVVGGAPTAFCTEAGDDCSNPPWHTPTTNMPPGQHNSKNCTKHCP